MESTFILFIHLLYLKDKTLDWTESSGLNWSELFAEWINQLTHTCGIMDDKVLRWSSSSNDQNHHHYCYSCSSPLLLSSCSGVSVVGENYPRVSSEQWSRRHVSMSLSLHTSPPPLQTARRLDCVCSLWLIIRPECHRQRPLQCAVLCPLMGSWRPRRLKLLVQQHNTEVKPSIVV